MRDETFFIGWEAEGPPSVMRVVRRCAMALLLIAGVVAGVVSAVQPPFASSNFEFGVVRTFEGIVEHHPFPVLVVERPMPVGEETEGQGTEGQGKARATHSRWLLTVFGKHGAEAHTAPLVGHRIRVQGSLIYRDEQTMVEILPETLEDLGAAAVADPPSVDAGVDKLGLPATLRGEIVDSKCFLGVMKPGNLKTHRACAARCISGGVPPVLLVRDDEGFATYFLLVGEGGEALNQEVLGFVAEPVEIEGAVYKVGDLSILRADPARIRRL